MSSENQCKPQLARESDTDQESDSDQESYWVPDISNTRIPPPDSPKHLLNLPILIQENYLKMMDPMDVLYFALTHPRATNIVKHCRAITIRNQEYTQVEFSENKVLIVFHETNEKKKEDRRFLQLKVDDEKKSSGSLVYDSKYGWSERHGTHPFAYVHEKLTVKHRKKDMEKATKSAINLITSIFHKTRTRVTVDIDVIPKINDFYIWEFLQWKCDDVEITGESIEHADLMKFLRRVEVKKGLKVDVREIKNQPSHLAFRFGLIQNLDVLAFRDAPWVQDWHLLQLKNQFISVKNTQVTLKGFKKWIHRWMDGDEKHFKMLIVGSQISFELNNVVRDIQNKERYIGSPTDLEDRKIGSFICRMDPMFDDDRRPNEVIYKLTRSDGSKITMYYEDYDDYRVSGDFRLVMDYV